MELPSIREFYKGRSVLVTGGTGFMGKVLIEKLLFSVPDVKNVYILMRPKRGKSVTQRLEDMQRLPLFDRIRNERPSVLKKLKGIQGDILFEDFGLSSLEIENLSKEISVLFHFAATLRLEAPLKDNVNMNTSGTLRTINVAKRFKNLVIFVHLSTAFCYPDYEVLGEKLYAPPAKPENVMKLIEWLDDKQMALLTPSLLGPHPNSYTFSKRLAENIVEQAYADLPIVIARPSIVCPAIKEPLAGWVDNLNGPVGVMLGAGKGVIRTMLCDGTLNAQVIPVDTAINAILAIGMIEGTKKEKAEVIPVYNVNIGHQKPTTWGDVLNVAKNYGRKYPLSWPLWYPNGDITTNMTLHEFRRVFYHLLPAYCIDLLLFLLGQKKLMVRIQNRISQGLEVLQYFTMRPWKFPCPNYDSIQSKLSKEEQEIFNTDLSDVDRDKYMHHCVEGGRVFCLKEDPTKTTVNRTYHNFLYVLDWVVKIIFWLFVLSFFAAWFKPVREVLSYGEPVVKHLPFLGAAVFKAEVIPVYNVNIGHQKPTTWGDVLNVAKNYGRKYPLSWPLWYPNGDITTNMTLHEFRRVFYHLLPAYCIDLLLFLLGQKKLMVRIQNRISQGLEVLQYFTMRPWKFPCPNYDSIQSKLSKEEQEIFNTDLSDVDRDKYMHHCVEGGRVFCLKEDPTKTTVNRTYHNFLYVLDWVVKIIFWLFVLSFFAAWFKPVREVLSYGEPVVKHLPFLGAAVFKYRAVP